MVVTDAMLPGAPGDEDTGETGMAGTDNDDAAAIGVGMEPDDAAEGQAMLDEARDSGELRPGPPTYPS